MEYVRSVLPSIFFVSYRARHLLLHPRFPNAPDREAPVCLGPEYRRGARRTENAAALEQDHRAGARRIRERGTAYIRIAVREPALLVSAFIAFAPIERDTKYEYVPLTERADCPGTALRLHLYRLNADGTFFLCSSQTTESPGIFSLLCEISHLFIGQFDISAPVTHGTFACVECC